MPVAADLSRCIPFASAFCHRIALYKQVALFNTVRADKFPASAIPTRKLWWCDKARDFISFWKYSLYCCSSFTSYFVYYPPFASDNFSITVLDTYRLPVWCSGFSIWNCEFHAVKLSVSRYETKWYHPMVSDFIHDFTLLSLRSLLRIHNSIEQETRNNWYYPNFPPSGRLRHTLNSLHFATL